MAYTLNFTDYKTYWIGLHAQMGKGQFVTVESLKYIKKYQLPFGMLSIHPDTGSEFINYHMKACCDELKIDMTRSRPGHCNDNMCVEERNGHVVRKKIGYIRIDCDESVIVLNKYYDKLYLLSNHFIAVRRTKEKVRIGSKYQRKFEIPRTPYQMVMVSNEISDIQKRNLKKIHESLNIFELQEDMKKLLLKIQRIQKEKRGKLF
jgi:transposase InsO family protein